MRTKCIILCLATIISISNALEEVPEYLKVCQKSDPHLVGCITESVNGLRPYLTNGIPDLDVPAIEPLLLGDLLVSETTDSKEVTISAKDIRAFGPSNFRIRKFNIVRFGEEYHFDITIPHLFVEGIYVVNGRILVILIKASGKFSGNFTSCSGSVKVILPKNKSSDDHVSVSKIEIKIKVGHGNITLKELFDGEKALADWLVQCPKESPNKDDCFRRMFEGMFPYLATGILELGIDHFEPLIIDQVQVSKGSGSLILAGGFNNLNVKGPSNATVSRASLDLEKNLLNFDLVIPRLRIDATYNLKGKILLLPLVGSGNVAMTMKDVKSSVYTKISIRQKPEDVIHIDEMKVTFLVGRMRIHLSNLFNGNKVLGASLNMFLNQNANEVISELRPDLEKGLANIFTGLWNNVFSKIPIKLWLQ